MSHLQTRYEEMVNARRGYLSAVTVELNNLLGSTTIRFGNDGESLVLSIEAASSLIHLLEDYYDLRGN